MFTTIIPHIIDSNCLVLLEHSTKLCNIDGIRDDKKNYMRTFGGSESVFLDLMEIKYENMLCVDNRMEVGMLTSIDEIDLQNRLDSLSSPSPKHIVASFEIMSILTTKREHIVNNITDKFKDSVYQKLMEKIYFPTITIQSFILLKFKSLYDKNKLNFNDKTIISDETNWNIYIEINKMLLENIIKIGSLLVDVNIINIIENSKDKHEKILVFVGNNHLERLVNHYEKNYNLKISVNNFNTKLTENMIMPSNYDYTKQIYHSLVEYERQTDGSGDLTEGGGQHHIMLRKKLHRSKTRRKKKKATKKTRTKHRRKFYRQ